MRSAAALVAVGLLPALAPWRPARAASGRTFHVDPESGDNSRGGLSRETALQSAPSANRLQPGDRVLFKGGTRYRGVVEASRSGTADAPITYDGNSRGEWGEGPAIIDGSEPLAGWLPAGDIHGARVWEREKPPGTPLAMLIHQGAELRLCALAQLPEPTELHRTEDLSRYHRWTRNWREKIDGEWAYFLEAPETLGEADEDLGDGALVRLHVTGNFVETYAILEHDPSRGVVRLAPKPLDGRGRPPDGSKLKRFALANVRSALRRPGQFVVEGNRILLRPHDDVDPNGAGLTIARQHGAMQISADHVHVRGFRIEKLRAGAGVRGRNGSKGRVKGLRVVGVDVRASRVARGIWFERCDDSIAYGNRISDLTAGRGVLLTNCGRGVVMKNRVERISGSCLSVYGGRDCAVIGNRIGNPLGVHSNGMSFYLGNKGTRVLFNTVLIPDARAFAMTMQDAENMVVAFNTLVTRDFASFSHHPDKGKTSESGGHAWLNNLILTAGDNRAFRIASKRARWNSVLVNNIADGFAVNGTAPNPFKARTRNVYTRLREGAGLSLDQLQAIGSFTGEREAMFRDISNWDLRPSKKWRNTLGRGVEYEINGVKVDWIGRYRPDGGEAWDWDLAGEP